MRHQLLNLHILARNCDKIGMTPPSRIFVPTYSPRRIRKVQNVEVADERLDEFTLIGT